jgi:pimeloyl-ACP methyl ester carboxylesterase
VLSDALEVAQFVDRYASGGSLHLHGFSMGAAVAAHVARELRASSLVLMAPPSDLSVLLPWESSRTKAWLTGLLPRSARNLFATAQTVLSISAPTLVLHGDNDRIVPLRHGKEVYAQSAASIKELIVLRGCTHSTLPYSGAWYSQTLRAWDAKQRLHTSASGAIMPLHQ